MESVIHRALGTYRLNQIGGHMGSGSLDKDYLDCLASLEHFRWDFLDCSIRHRPFLLSGECAIHLVYLRVVLEFLATG